MAKDVCLLLMSGKVSFLDGIQKVQEWSKILYKKEEFKGLILLRVNLKNRKWHMDLSNDFVFGLYLPYKVIPEELITWI